MGRPRWPCWCPGALATLGPLNTLNHPRPPPLSSSLTPAPLLCLYPLLRDFSTLALSIHQQIAPVDFMTTDIQNLKSFDPFAEVDDAGGEVKSTQQNYIHIRIQRTYLFPLAPKLWHPFYTMLALLTATSAVVANPLTGTPLVRPQQIAQG